LVVTRFAPSPTGRLHLGHVFAAGFAWGRAVRSDGVFIVRLEDIDFGRCRAAFVDGIFEDLAWMGLTWVEPVLRQSQQMERYALGLKQLEEMGVVYPCFCTRAEVQAEVARMGNAPHGPEGVLYPGICRRLSGEERAEALQSGKPYALRLDVEAACRITGPLGFYDEVAGLTVATPEILGDVVLARKETPASYHLSATLDDAFQGVTLVTRGDDLFASTHVHRLLQALLHLPTPTYHHHKLILDNMGKRLAKRDNSVTIQYLRETGATPAEIWRMVGMEI